MVDLLKLYSEKHCSAMLEQFALDIEVYRSEGNDPTRLRHIKAYYEQGSCSLWELLAFLYSENKNTRRYLKDTLELLENAYECTAHIRLDQVPGEQ